MSTDVDSEQAQRLREAETRWLQQSATRIREARQCAAGAGRERTEEQR
jgi:hypothetical protein